MAGCPVHGVDRCDCLGREPAARGGQFNAEQIYRNSCSVCHGEKGDGQSGRANSLNPAPRNFTSPEETAQLTASA